QVRYREPGQARAQLAGSNGYVLSRQRVHTLISREPDSAQEEDEGEQTSSRHLGIYSFLSSSRTTSFNRADGSAFFFPGGFLYNSPRIVTTDDEPASDSRPCDNSVGEIANDWPGAISSARLPEASLTILPRAVSCSSATLTPLS